LVTGGSSRSTSHGTPICHPLRNQLPDSEMRSKWNGVERETRWHNALGAVSVLLRMRNITMYVLLYCIHVKKSRVEQRDRPSAGGFSVRLISTKFIEEEILHLLSCLDIAPCTYHAYCTVPTQAGRSHKSIFLHVTMAPGFCSSHHKGRHQPWQAHQARGSCSKRDKDMRNR
jgi:hypothetical protein